MDPYEFLKITLNPDGTLKRSAFIPTIPSTDRNQPVVFGNLPLDAAANENQPIIFTDLPLDPALGTTIRLFAPKSPKTKLPIIFYFHAGGFICFSSSTCPFHLACASLAAAVPAVVLSVDYRLAPENRLPAAYDDATAVLHWLRPQALAEQPTHSSLLHVDFSLCFLMGSSSGGNIVFHAALRALGDELSPLRIAGLIFNQPYFGGEERTESERRLEDDKIVPLVVNDLMWELALPEGADREHEYASLARFEGRVKGLAPSLVRVCGGDPLVDRGRELVRLLERGGVKVVESIDDDGCHGVEYFDSAKEEKRLEDVRGFVWSIAGGGGDSGVGREKL